MSKIVIIPDPSGPRLSAPLAEEIGLRESIVLLQISYWIERMGQYINGKWWIYQSLRQLRDQFPFMEKNAINRVIHSLIEKELITVTNRYNHRPGDKTRWIALNPIGCKKLKSVEVKTVKESLSQNGLTLYQNEPAIEKDLKTLNTIQKDAGSTGKGADGPPREDTDALIDAWMDEGLENLSDQPFLSSAFLPRHRGQKPVSIDPIPKVLHSVMYRLCYRAETEQEQLAVSSTQRGVVASVLGQLRSFGSDIERLHVFEAWWNQNWRSRDRTSDQYQAPRPHQVLELWNEAMKSGIKPKPKEIEPETPKHSIAELAAIMTKHRDKK